jgi:diguanylate cyclase (GGDEF)-like protein
MNCATPIREEEPGSGESVPPREAHDVAFEVFDRLTQPIAVLDADGRLLFANRSCAALFPRYCAPGSSALAAVMLSERERIIGMPMVASAPQAEFEMDHDGRLLAVSIERLSQDAQLVTFNHLSPRDVHLRDSLTGLPDRAALKEKIRDALNNPRERDGYALHSVEIDRLPDIYATIGYRSADRLMMRIVDRLVATVGPEDRVARIDASRFGILQRAEGQPDAAQSLTRKLIDILGRAFLVDDHVLHIAVNVGTTLLSEDIRVPYDALRHAELALSEAKSDGRGQSRLFEPTMGERAETRRSLEEDLGRALVAGEFSLNFQPEICAGTGRMLGCETLIRWTHPTLGPISPARFIPIAEEGGQIIEIGEWVLRTACEEAARWQPGTFVAINLSPLQFSDPRLTNNVARALHRSGLAPERLELEITEGILLRDTVSTLAILRQLKEIGVRIAMDDFGTGFSSLSYMRLFPFDKIKIDQSFVSGVPTDRSAAAIVRAMIGLARDLGMTVSAEGVETQEQLEFLRAEGCEQIQGYLVSRPLTAVNLIAFQNAARHG